MDDQTLTQLLSDLPENPTATDYRGVALTLLPYIQSNVPPMGESLSIVRLRFLTAVARHDLGLARIIEGHLDATQILREATRPADGSKLYGIWASGGPADTTDITKGGAGDGNAVLTGSKPFCSGSDIVDRGLIYVYPAEQLLDVNMREAGSPEYVHFETGQWKSTAFSETHTWTVRFEGFPVTDENRIGGYKWYFDRPGFCLGAMVSSVGSIDAMLRLEADQIDAYPYNTSGSPFPTALLVRHHIERACTDVLDRFGRTLGPRPFAFETDNARRIAELTLYIQYLQLTSFLFTGGCFFNQPGGMKEPTATIFCYLWIFGGIGNAR